MEDVFTLLKQDHDKVKKLIKEYEAEESPQKKMTLAQTIFEEVEIHSKAEEEVFYPAIEEEAEEEAMELVEEAYEEHKVVKRLIDEMKKLQMGSEFEAKFKVFHENLEHHIKEEESELFPKAKKALEGEVEEVTEELEAMKEKLKAEEAEPAQPKSSKPKSGKSHASASH